MGPQSVALPGSRLGEFTVVCPKSLVPPFAHLPGRSVWEGSPLGPAKNQDAAEVWLEQERAVCDRRWNLWAAALQFLSVVVVVYVVGMATVPTQLLVLHAELFHPTYGVGIVLAFSPPLTQITYMFLCILMKWVLVGRLRERTYYLGTVRFCCWWIVDTLLQSAIVTSLFEQFSQTPLLRWVYRALGMRVGTGTLLTPLGVGCDLELLSFGDHVWTGSLLSAFPSAWGLRARPNVRVPVRAIHVGSRVLFGETVALLGGCHVGDGSTIGSATILREGVECPPDSVFVGLPAVVLSGGERVMESTTRLVGDTSGTASMNLASEDLKNQEFPFWIQVFVFLTSLADPILLGAGVFLETFVYGLGDQAEIAVLIATGSYVGLCLGLAALLILFKRLVVGKMVDTHFPLTNFSFVNWHLLTQLATLCETLFISQILGTVYLCWWARLLGSKIGKRVYLDTHLPPEFDVLEVGDDAVIDSGSLIIGHVVDNGHRQHARIRIGKGAFIGPGVVVQPGADVAENVGIMSLSLLMKGEALPPNSLWSGSPLNRSHSPRTQQEVSMEVLRRTTPRPTPRATPRTSPAGTPTASPPSSPRASSPLAGKSPSQKSGGPRRLDLANVFVRDPSGEYVALEDVRSEPRRPGFFARLLGRGAPAPSVQTDRYGAVDARPDKLDARLLGELGSGYL